MCTVSQRHREPIFLKWHYKAGYVRLSDFVKKKKTGSVKRVFSSWKCYLFFNLLHTYAHIALTLYAISTRGVNTVCHFLYMVWTLMSFTTRMNTVIYYTWCKHCIGLPFTTRGVSALCQLLHVWTLCVIYYTWCEHWDFDWFALLSLIIWRPCDNL